MKETTLSIRYARALMKALSVKKHERARDDFEGWVALCNENRELRLFINNPFVDEKDKVEITTALAKRGGCDKMLLNFLLVLIREDRFDHLDDIFYSFDKMVRGLREKMAVVVESAVELSAKETKKIAGFLQNRFQRQVEIETEINPQLLGGVRIRVGDKIIDATVVNNLQLLKQSIVGR